jgi:hypothetical protein
MVVGDLATHGKEDVRVRPELDERGAARGGGEAVDDEDEHARGSAGQQANRVAARTERRRPRRNGSRTAADAAVRERVWRRLNGEEGELALGLQGSRLFIEEQRRLRRRPSHQVPDVDSTDGAPYRKKKPSRGGGLARWY